MKHRISVLGIAALCITMAASGCMPAVRLTPASDGDVILLSRSSTASIERHFVHKDGELVWIVAGQQNWMQPVDLLAKYEPGLPMKSVVARPNINWFWYIGRILLGSASWVGISYFMDFAPSISTGKSPSLGTGYLLGALAYLGIILGLPDYYEIEVEGDIASRP